VSYSIPTKESILNVCDIFIILVILNKLNEPDMFTTSINIYYLKKCYQETFNQLNNNIIGYLKILKLKKYI